MRTVITVSVVVLMLAGAAAGYIYSGLYDVAAPEEDHADATP